MSLNLILWQILAPLNSTQFWSIFTSYFGYFDKPPNSALTAKIHNLTNQVQRNIIPVSVLFLKVEKLRLYLGTKFFHLVLSHAKAASPLHLLTYDSTLFLDLPRYDSTLFADLSRNEATSSLDFSGNKAT